MAHDLTIFDEASERTGWPRLDDGLLARQIELANGESAVRFARMMAYYRNEQRESAGLGGAVDAAESGRPYTQGQEYGLPPRITGLRHDGFGAIFAGQRVEGIRRKEVVIENDIAWRIDTMIHFLLGQPVRIESTAADPALRQKIDTALKAALEANGGVLLLQEMALFAHVYGFADVVLRVDADRPSPPADADERQRLIAAASRIVLELVEAERAVPIVNETDYRRLDYYAQHFVQRVNRLDGDGRPAEVAVTEILGPHAWQRYHDNELAAEGENPLGRIPVVHLQNLPRPFCYEGESDVERLIPLQDELNTRLSDRANRISFQSFRMYLGCGIENFEDRPIAPGRMWSTDNPEATIKEFGGDSGSPSEDAHIAQVREALDKISGVPPVAAGLVRDRIGQLTSGTALRLTLVSLLSKTARKQACYGAAIEQLCQLVLAWLDVTGALPTSAEDRRVTLHWPDMLPDNPAERLQQATLKRQLGVPARRVLAELGYGPAGRRGEAASAGEDA